MASNQEFFQDLSLSPSARTVLDALRSGRGLSNLLAIANLGVGSLSSRVAELRKQGYGITGKMETSTNGKAYKVYRLADAANPKPLSPAPEKL